MISTPNYFPNFMNEKRTILISKFLSKILRHDPSAIGLTLDSLGWADIDILLKNMAQNRRKITREQLEHIVETNNKRRFIISEDGNRIRANQGHSININLGLSPTTPPEFLYHGTATRFIESIREKGLVPGSRQHVHLSENQNTAHQVGSRHGKPIILQIQAKTMHQKEHRFYLSENGVWLIDSIPVEYITIPERL